MCYTLHTHREEMRGGNKVGYAVVHMMKIKSGAAILYILTVRK